MQLYTKHYGVISFGEYIGWAALMTGLGITLGNIAWLIIQNTPTWASITMGVWVVIVLAAWPCLCARSRR